MAAMTIDNRGAKIAHAIALLVFVVMFALPCAAQEKFRFPIGESSKTLSYGPLWVAAKMGFFERESLDAPIITMRGSPLTIQALTADSIYVASAGVDALISAYERGADITMIGGLINGYFVKRSWAEKNRALVVRFMKAMASTMRWMMDNRAAACGYLSKEMAISIEHCRYAADYNWKSRIWDRNADLNLEGVRTLIKLVAEQGILKEPLPEPTKYIDQSYLKQALAEIDRK